jgi:hypothetical protein
MTQETLWWKLFPFSLIGKEKQWYSWIRMGIGMNLRTSFVLHFSQVLYRLSTKSNPRFQVVREGAYRCSLG